MQYVDAVNIIEVKTTRGSHFTINGVIIKSCKSKTISLLANLLA